VSRTRYTGHEILRGKPGSREKCRLLKREGTHETAAVEYLPPWFKCDWSDIHVPATWEIFMGHYRKPDRTDHHFYVKARSWTAARKLIEYICQEDFGSKARLHNVIRAYGPTKHTPLTTEPRCRDCGDVLLESGRCRDCDLERNNDR